MRRSLGIHARGGAARCGMKQPRQAARCDRRPPGLTYGDNVESGAGAGSPGLRRTAARQRLATSTGAVRLSRLPSGAPLSGLADVAVLSALTAGAERSAALTRAERLSALAAAEALAVRSLLAAAHQITRAAAESTRGLAQLLPHLAARHGGEKECDAGSHHGPEQEPRYGHAPIPRVDIGHVRTVTHSWILR